MSRICCALLHFVAILPGVDDGADEECDGAIDGLDVPVGLGVLLGAGLSVLRSPPSLSSASKDIRMRNSGVRD